MNWIKCSDRRPLMFCNSYGGQSDRVLIYPRQKTGIKFARLRIDHLGDDTLHWELLSGEKLDLYEVTHWREIKYIEEE